MTDYDALKSEVIAAKKQAKEAIVKSLPEDALAVWAEKGKEERKAAIERRHARKDRVRERNRKIIDLVVEGLSVFEIQAKTGYSARYVKDIGNEVGIPYHEATTYRFRRVKVTHEQEAALQYLAADMDLTPDAAFKKVFDYFVAFALSDDALVARRQLKVQRRLPL